MQKYTYPKSYKIKPLEEQVEVFRSIFNFKNYIINNDGVEGGEGLFAIPHWKLIGTTYNDAVLKVMEKMKESRPFYDWREGNWTEKYLKQLPIKERFWKEQREEIITISAQFGAKHSGKSVEKVRRSLSNNELPFGIYEVLIMLLTHPERLQSYDDLWIDCSGDEYSWDGDDDFSQAPDVYFSDGEVKAGTRDLDYANDYFGTASGFVPQPLENRNIESFESLTLESAIKMVKENGYKIFKEI